MALVVFFLHLKELSQDLLCILQYPKEVCTLLYLHRLLASLHVERVLNNGSCSEGVRRFGKPGSVGDVVFPTSLPRCLTRKGTVLFLAGSFSFV